VQAFAQSVDIMPTIIDFLGLPTTLEQQYRAPAKNLFPQDMVAASKTVELEGQSLLPLMDGAKDKIRDLAYTGHYGRSWTVRTREWSFHVLLSNGERRLFNLIEDPGEHNDIRAEHEHIAHDLELALRRHVDWVQRKRAAS